MNRQEKGRPRVMVIGIGNPDRGDDRIGPLVAERLAGRLPADVAVSARHGAALSLIEDWAGVDALVLVDAAAPMGRPGRIHRIDLAVDPLPPGPAAASSHGIGLAEALALARALGEAPAEIIVYAVEGGGFEIGAALSPAVAAAAAKTADRIVGEVRRLQQIGDEATTNA